MLRLIKSDYLKLVPIVVLAFYFAFIPHQDYPYPVHVDEWVQMAYSQAILEAGDTAFVAITGKYVYTKIHGYPGDTDKKAIEFLQNGCTDTDFLRKNGISIVYSRSGCKNPDLVEVVENVYLLRTPETP